MDEDELFTLQHFTIESVSTSKIYLIVGDNDHLANLITRDICQHLAPKINFVAVFSASSKFNNIYSDYVPQSCVFHQYQKSTILNLFGQQKKNLLKLQKSCENEHVREALNTLVIIDRENAKWLKDNDLNDFFGFARDMNITIIWRNVESSKCIPQNLRHKFDYCFVLTAAPSMNEMNNIFRQFGGAAPNQKSFKQMLNENLTLDTAVVIDVRRSIERKDHDADLLWLQNFAKYKPSAISLFPFRLGLDKLWHFKEIASIEQEGKEEEEQEDHIRARKPKNTVDLQDILASYAPNKKIRIEIVEQPEEKQQDNQHSTISYNESLVPRNEQSLLYRYLSDC